MAATLMTTKVRSLVYRTPSLKTLSNYIRLFSSHSNGQNETAEELPKPAKISEPWLNIRAGIFGPDDGRLPFPGDVGMSLKVVADFASKSAKPKIPKKNRYGNRVVLEDEHAMIVDDSVQKEIYRYKKENYVLECVVQECPLLIMKDIAPLFTDINMSDIDITVVTLCQKTKNDMSGWSEAVEAEREELIAEMVSAASDICDMLVLEGYWADFIDPTSGRPYYGCFTNNTMFETDERYRNLGFEIEDLGCCKVIRHKKWGSHIFVGALFTNAPVNCDILEHVLTSCSSSVDVMD